jgi:di/tricarboxylate transporter
MYDLTIVIIVLVLVLSASIFNWLVPAKIFLLACGVLLLSGVLQPEHALVGFSNVGVFTIAALYIVVAGLRESGGTMLLRRYLVGQPKSQNQAMNRILPITTLLSAFVNNTPVVAMFTNLVQSLNKRFDIQLSAILIPISYASIFGGVCTLIGTSTNLVVDGLYQAQGYKGFALFELAYVGIPIAIVGFIYLKLVSPYLLPKRESAIEQFSHVREYMVEMIIQPGSELENKSIKDAGLRNLPGLFLVEIERNNDIITAICSTTVMEKDDRLIFAGDPSSVMELQNIHGLKLADQQRFKLEGNHSERRLFEAVLSPSNSILGKTIKESRFRHRYNGVVLSVSRHGERLTGKLGEIRLQAGDTLLIEAQKGFLFRYKYSQDFLLVSKLGNGSQVDSKKSGVSIAIFLAMIFTSGLGILPIFQSAILACGLMVVTGCISFEDAAKSIDYSVLLVIACAFSLGAAVTQVGLAATITDSILLVATTPMLSLIAIYVSTLILTEIITNNAAAIIMFPIAMSAANTLGLNVEPFAVAVMVAASASFITPTGYQTNLMVMGPGGYKYSDFVKVGTPLSLIVAVIALTIIPLVWRF